MPHGLVTVTPERWEHHYEPNAAYTVYTYPLPHMHAYNYKFIPYK